MSNQFYWLLSFMFSIFFLNCFNSPKVTLQSVSTVQFSEFVMATNYVTDAEKYGWSIVQKNVYEFEVVYGVDWRCPTGYELAKPSSPVTQVSFNDAMAYCRWTKTKLPTYSEYWSMVSSDNRPIVQSAPTILPVNQANLVGNVWEITTTKNPRAEIRLAGGSYLCNTNTCNGTVPARQLWVDSETGNSHISFAVIQ